MRRPIVLILVLLGVACAVYVLGAGPEGADEDAPPEVDAEVASSAAEAEAPPAGAGATEAEVVDRTDATRTEPAAAVREAAVLVGTVFDLAHGSIHTGPFEGARVEVRAADNAYEERMLRDVMRGIDFVVTSRRRPPSIESSVSAAAPVHVAETDAEGKFRIEGVAPNRWISVRIVADGYLPHEVPRVFPIPGEERSLGRVDMLHGGVVAGVVLDEHERPVEGADVLVGQDVVTRSAADGRFEVGGLRFGLVTLRARREGELSTLAPTLELMAQTNDRIDGVRLLLPVGVDTPGRVSNPRGAPIEAATVVARFDGVRQRGAPSELTVRTDGEGRFLLRGLTPGTTFDVEVSHPAAATVRVEGAEAGRPFAITLEPAPRLLFRLVQEGTGNGLEPDFAVLMTDETPQRFDARDLARLHVRGSIYGLPIPGAGQAKLVASAPLHGLGGTEEPIFLDGARDVGPITIEMERLPAIIGQVVAVGGAPIPRARLEHVDEDGRVVARGTSRADGRFLLPRVSDGGQVVATADGYARGTRATLGEVLIVLRPEHRLVGTVTDFDGGPRADFGLLVVGPVDGSAPFSVTRCRTDGKGRYHAKNLHEALYRVLVAACAALEEGAEIHVSGESRYNLDLRRSHGTLRGEVFVNDLPADGAIVRLIARSYRGRRRPLDVSTAPGGGYRFPLLPAGEYELSVLRDGRALGEPHQVTITGGRHAELPLVLRPSRLSGRMSGLGGDRATVSISRPRHEFEDDVLTDAQGNFEILDLAPGSYRVSARAPGRVTTPRTMNVAAGANGPIDLALGPATHAVIAAPEDGPWRLAWWSVTPEGGESFTPRVTRREGGDHVLERLPLGKVKIEARFEADIAPNDFDARRAFLRRNGRTMRTLRLEADLKAEGENRVQ